MKFKCLYLLFALLITVSSLFSQENSPEKSGIKVGITFALFGDNPVIPFVMLCGAPSYDGEGFYTAGIACKLR